MNLLGMNLVHFVLAVMLLQFIQTDRAIASPVENIVVLKETRICYYIRHLGEPAKCVSLKREKLKEFPTTESSREFLLEI